ncbi:nitroreductase/quinone reductase family protein [Mycobacterium sp. smrl_JER01]|uniref:nitroreductase/quinone reductase family protein n=1 Tax=Mycobacterium sp. smrl_JER01 TaxID=3402633 RepID=UPI003ACE2544
MTDPEDMNTQLIQEFRANDGKVASFGNGEMPLLVLHTTGAKSGRKRVSLLIYQDLGGSWAVFASNGGASTHPAWYHNIIANPHVEIEVGSATHRALARVADMVERQSIWDAQRAVMPEIDDIAANSSRLIPVVVLDPAP